MVNGQEHTTAYSHYFLPIHIALNLVDQHESELVLGGETQGGLRKVTRDDTNVEIDLQAK
jgi:hypothetical protein